MTDTLWRPSDKVPRATFSPIVPVEPLTDEDRRRLESHPALERYPMGDYFDMPRLRFVRWLRTQEGADG